MPRLGPAGIPGGTVTVQDRDVAPDSAAIADSSRARSFDAEGWELHLGTGRIPWSAQVPQPRSRFRARSSHRRWDDLVVVQSATDPFTARRTRHEIGYTPQSSVVALVVDSGELTVAQGERRWNVGAGQALLWSTDVAVRVWVARPTTTRQVVAPRAVFDDVGCRFVPGPPHVGRLPALQLLRSFLDSLAGLPASSGGDMEVAARNALLELMWGALRPDLPLNPQALRLSRRAAVERSVDSRLDDPGLGVDDVAAAHGLSTRSLARLFQESGDTFSGVLRAKRLARVREDLLTGALPLDALARRWGVVDASHLTRRFRSVYGMPPHEYRMRARATD